MVDEVRLVPSIWKEFSSVPEPKADMVVEPWVLWDTPGEAASRSNMLKRGTGAFLTQSLS